MDSTQRLLKASCIIFSDFFGKDSHVKKSWNKEVQDNLKTIYDGASGKSLTKKA